MAMTNRAKEVHAGAPLAPVRNNSFQIGYLYRCIEIVHLL